MSTLRSRSRSAANVLIGALAVAVCLSFGIGTASVAAPRWAGLGILAVVALGGIAVYLWRARPIRFGPTDAAVAGFLAYAALSGAWAEDSAAAADYFLRFATLGLVYVFVRMTPGAWPALTAAIGISFVGAVALGFAVPSLYGGFGNENFAAEFILASSPFVFRLWNDIDQRTRGGWASSAFLFLAVPASIVYLVGFNASNLEYLVAFAALLFVVVIGWRRLRPPLAIALFAVGLLMLVINPAMWREREGLPDSVVERAEIWINTAAMWWEEPAFGHGLGSYNREYPRFAEEHMAVLGPGTFMESPIGIVGAAHNDWAQLAAELGVIGLGLAGLVLLFAWRDVADRWRALMAPIASIAILIVLSLVGFPFQNPATAFVGAVALGMLPAPRSRAIVVPLWCRRLGGAVAVLVAMGLATMTTLWFIGDRHAVNVRAWMKHDPAAALSENFLAWHTYPLATWTRHQMIVSLKTVIANQHRPGYVPASVFIEFEPEAIERVWQVATSASPHHAGVLLARAELLLNSGREDEMAPVLDRLEEIAPGRPETWLTAAYYHATQADVPAVENAIGRVAALDGGIELLDALGLIHKEGTEP